MKNLKTELNHNTTTAIQFPAINVMEIYKHIKQQQL